MDLPITVPLKRSVIHDGQTYDALTLDEPAWMIRSLIKSFWKQSPLFRLLRVMGVSL